MGRTLTIAPIKIAGRDIPLRGRGLLLIPSVLAFRVWPRGDPPWDPALTYQPHRVGDLWSPETAGNALRDLIGDRRAAILQHLDRPASTLELARATGWSSGGVNSHLGVLRANGVVTRRREGRSVLDLRTAAGDKLCGR